MQTTEIAETGQRSTPMTAALLSAGIVAFCWVGQYIVLKAAFPSLINGIFSVAELAIAAQFLLLHFIFRQTYTNKTKIILALIISAFSTFYYLVFWSTKPVSYALILALSFFIVFALHWYVTSDSSLSGFWSDIRTSAVSKDLFSLVLPFFIGGSVYMFFLFQFIFGGTITGAYRFWMLLLAIGAAAAVFKATRAAVYRFPGLIFLYIVLFLIFILNPLYSSYASRNQPQQGVFGGPQQDVGFQMVDTRNAKYLDIQDVGSKALDTKSLGPVAHSNDRSMIASIEGDTIRIDKVEKGIRLKLENVPCSLHQCKLITFDAKDKLLYFSDDNGTGKPHWWKLVIPTDF